MVTLNCLMVMVWSLEFVSLRGGVPIKNVGRWPFKKAFSQKDVDNFLKVSFLKHTTDLVIYFVHPSHRLSSGSFILSQPKETSRISARQIQNCKKLRPTSASVGRCGLDR